MNKIGIIISREFNERVRKKSFIITTLLMPILMLAMMVAPTLILLFAKGEQKTRFFLLLNGTAWLAYTAAVRATAFFTCVAAIVSALIAMVKYRKKA